MAEPGRSAGPGSPATDRAASTDPAGAAILLVEDEPDVARVIADALEDRGHRVYHARRGREARVLVGEARPDLIILDLILPDVDGLTLCWDLHQQTDVPVLICSATKRKRDAVLGIKMCAEDFIAKPFDLEARVEALLRRRRGPGAAPGVDAERPSGRMDGFGGLVLDPVRRLAVVGPHAAALTPTEFKVLTILVRRAGDVVARDELAQLLWGPHSADLGRGIDSHVSHLQRKLRAALADSAPPLAVVAVRGVGYALIEERRRAPRPATDAGREAATTG